MKQITLLSLIILLASCAALDPQIQTAKAQLKTRDYLEALNTLAKNETKAAAQLKSQIEFEQGLEILANTTNGKAMRHLEAKEHIRQALKYNPKNQEAREIYQALIKTVSYQSIN